jgi:hypothetical protein
VVTIALSECDVDLQHSDGVHVYRLHIIEFVHGDVYLSRIFIQALDTVYYTNDDGTHAFFSSFSRLPNVYANPQPATLTAQSARDPPLTTPRAVSLFLIPYKLC